MKLEYGDIILFESTGLIGDLIIAIDSHGLGHYSHAGVFLGYWEGVPLFIETHEKNKRGIAIIALQEWGNYSVYRPAFGPRPIKETLELLNRTSYDTKRLISIALLRWFGKRIRPDNSNKMICAEVPNFVYNYRLLEPGYETPWELEKLEKKGIIKLIYSTCKNMD